ncbi:hypothetical protein OCH239_15680 [Roseivivax halodurans JCM 10272]|uniref:Uncharacterized protein n=1 Tax=Roseivivax halodurans JCM 10272 TaxID=1449350 RepID=X7E9V7_9RHOB|nr:hypothetical protein OCH239_15680 [Roseivivax halodurans JCM 10272]
MHLKRRRQFIAFAGQVGKLGQKGKSAFQAVLVSICLGWAVMFGSVEPYLDQVFFSRTA